MLKGKKILLGITGSIAAYKSILLLRLLVKAGAEVKVVISPAAREFVPQLTLSTLSNQPVLCEISGDQGWSNHVMLGRWADCMVIAPLSCNTLAKMASGQCDNLLLAVYLSATCPVLVAPAMDEDMWKHPSTKANLQKIQSFGNQVIPVTHGDLASGLVGEGRMAEPEDILSYISNLLSHTPLLKGKKALVSAGPTHEPLDPVRFIGNHSSGKMGIALATELQKQGAEVTLVLGPVGETVLPEGIKTIRVKTAADMFKACSRYFPKSDITVMAAAVADYTPVKTAKDKIKKSDPLMVLELTRTTDILASLGKVKRKNQVLVGFALETTDGEAAAKEKLKKKNADIIVLNSLQDKDAGFGTDTNKVTIFTKQGDKIPFDNKSKTAVAQDIIATVIRLYYA